MSHTPDGEENMIAEAMAEIELQAPFRIENDGDEVVVRFRRNGLTDRQISRHLAMLHLEAIAQKSRLTEEDALRLGDEVNRAVSERARRRLGLSMREKAI